MRAGAEVEHWSLADFPWPQEAFSLLAYPNPWTSPVGGQLDPAGREPVAAMLNSAILGITNFGASKATNGYCTAESKSLPGRPPLEVCLAHSSHLLKLMSNGELGACAFADIQSVLN